MYLIVIQTLFFSLLLIALTYTTAKSLQVRSSVNCTFNKMRLQHVVFQFLNFYLTYVQHLFLHLLNVLFSTCLGLSGKLCFKRLNLLHKYLVGLITIFGIINTVIKLSIIRFCNTSR